MFLFGLIVGALIGCVVMAVLAVSGDADTRAASCDVEALQLQTLQLENDVEEVKNRAAVNAQAMRAEIERLEEEKKDLVEGAILTEDKFRARLKQADEQISFERRKNQAIYLEGFEAGLNKNVMWGGVA